MNYYRAIQVGMHVFLKDGYEGNFKGCIGRVIAKRITPGIGGSNLLVDFSLDGNKPPLEGHKNHIRPYDTHKYVALPEALETPKYASRWWVNHNYITTVLNNTYLDGGLL